MIDVEEFRLIALSFPEAAEEPHFDKVSFRVKKKIFATLDLEKKTAVLKLTDEQQAEFSLQNDGIIYPVKWAWGKKGWTIIELEKARREVLFEGLNASYRNVAPKKLLGN